ncbi:MAG: hypothetical protein J07HX64_00892 [halophilic archaeon J07HX64]|nr:MAG: hypothetical protein J07HX64_00892 [halophilic archaeon J07HX64]
MMREESGQENLGLPAVVVTNARLMSVFLTRVEG